MKPLILSNRDSEAAFTFVVNFMVPGPPFRNLVMSWSSDTLPPFWGPAASTVSGLRQSLSIMVPALINGSAAAGLNATEKAWLSSKSLYNVVGSSYWTISLQTFKIQMTHLQAAPQTRRRRSSIRAPPRCATARGTTTPTTAEGAVSPQRRPARSATPTTATATSPLPSTPASRGALLTIPYQKLYIGVDRLPVTPTSPRPSTPAGARRAQIASRC